MMQIMGAWSAPGLVTIGLGVICLILSLLTFYRLRVKSRGRARIFISSGGVLAFLFPILTFILSGLQCETACYLALGFLFCGLSISFIGFLDFLKNLDIETLD